MSLSQRVYGLLALGLILSLVAGFFGFLHPAFDTVAHFRWHFALALLLIAILGVQLKIRQIPLIVLFFAAIGIWTSNGGNRSNFSQFTEVQTENGPLNKKVNGTKITLLQYNLRFNNPRKEEVLAMISKENADILTLNETSRQWMPALETLKSEYPFVFHCPEWRAIGGGMIFSKFPMRSENNYCHTYAALGMTEIQIAGKWIEIGAVHMRWPWPASGPKQLVALEPKLKKIGSDALIAGDFNAATWSYAVSKFADLSGMKVQRGFGGTWIYKWLPTSLAPFFGLPIDQVMSKGNVRISKVKTLPAIGSDHLPLLADILITGA